MTFYSPINKEITENADLQPACEFVTIEGERFYRITHFDQMDTFFMTIVSPSDHWMFISSNGALTAGRKNPDNAIFPYYTVDKIHDSNEITGSKTIAFVKRDGHQHLWEPFSERYSGIYDIKRNIYKSIFSNIILFEEINEDLGITFSYQWMNSERFGFVKKSSFRNNSSSSVSISFIDGIQNVLPAGINRSLQLSLSNLVDAYKKNELIGSCGLGLYMLSSIIIDKAEPSEALKTNIVWYNGIDNATILLSSTQINNFRKGLKLVQETDVRATRGAYFIHSNIEINPSQSKEWHIVTDINKNAGEIVSLKQFLLSTNDISAQISNDINKGSKELFNILSATDAIQLTGDQTGTHRHLSNVLFNVMRGGYFVDNYTIESVDFIEFVLKANSIVYLHCIDFLNSLDSTVLYTKLLNLILDQDNTQLLRLCYEYLPLAFSRRHGDPSRPWNLFSIETKKDDGSKNLFYQGNWRDIFQNWEALAISYPAFVEGMICKFLNAITADGYNPYRITRNGIDWEIPDPHDPWANIGYWGDHQVIYLQKLLEISKKHHPGALQKMLTSDIFAYADVPYKIKTYTELVQNPFDTIVFDYEAEKKALGRVSKYGSDGKLIWGIDNQVFQVNFTEKILAIILAKMSNFIPEGGIWLNTQRPEWNDANNALVGNGVSMVTLYYMRRLLVFSKELFEETPNNEIKISIEIIQFFELLFSVFLQFEHLLNDNISDHDRKLISDGLGKAGSIYREEIYKKGFSGEVQPLPVRQITDFFALVLKYIDHTIRKNKRFDNLYHAYNLIALNNNGISIRHLFEMLEGQVAILSSGFLQVEEVNRVLMALKNSKMFRSDQYSYMLYPDRLLPRFMEKNIIPAHFIENNALLSQLISENNSSLIYQDCEGNYHFNADFRNASDLKKAMETLSLIKAFSDYDMQYIMMVYEAVFDHQSFTGRSGAFYGYEGLGCIYWHMVSKLLLAINENYFLALNSKSDSIELNKLVEHYYEVRAGIGLNKSPKVYGAFPTDAYSHTPGNGGAKQPGMTGQVKEDILSRFGELGVVISDGKISINPGLLRHIEFLSQPATFNFLSVKNIELSIVLDTNSLAFTYCQVPFVYHVNQKKSITVTCDDKVIETDGLTLDLSISAHIFERTGYVKQIDVYLSPNLK